MPQSQQGTYIYSSSVYGLHLSVVGKLYLRLINVLLLSGPSQECCQKKTTTLGMPLRRHFMTPWNIPGVKDIPKVSSLSVATYLLEFSFNVICW